ncbi:MAG: tetratricopeptide repeat protein [Elusimicrobiaceae bacterium]
MNRKVFLIAAVFSFCFTGGLARAWDQASAEKYLEGLINESSGDYSAAFSNFADAIKDDPDALEAYRDAIKTALRTGHIKEAEKYIGMVLAKEPDKAENYALSGMINWGNGKIPEALADYKKGLELDPQNPDVLYQLSLLLRDTDPKASLHYLQRYAATNPPEVPKAEFDIAVLKLKLGDVDGAMAGFRKAADYSPDFLQPRYALAQLYEVRGDTEAVVNVYEEIIAKDEKNVALYLKVADLYVKSQQYLQAEPYLKKVLELEPDNAAANLWFAAISETRKDYAAAAAYVKASGDYDSDVSLWLRRSYYLTQQKKFREAVDVLGAAYLRWPANDDVAYFYALGLFDLNDFQKAYDIFLALYKKNPANIQVIMQYGVAAEKLNKLPEMEEAFRSILEKEPDDVIVLNYLGYALADRGLKLDEARVLVEKAAKLAPNNGAVQDSLGWISYKTGQYEKALAEIKAAIKSSPYDADIWEHLGDIYSVLKSTGHAWKGYSVAAVLSDGADAQLDKKIKNAADLLGDGQLGVLYPLYLRQVFGGYEKFSGLCNVEFKMMGKSGSFKGIINFAGNEKLTLTVTGPMFTPVWKAELVKKDGVLSFSQDAVNLLGYEDERFAALSKDVMSLLWDYFSGVYYEEGSAEYSSGWGGKKIGGNGYELKLSDNGQIREINRVKNSELSFRIADYSRYGLHLIPQNMEFSRFGFSVAIKILRVNPVFSTNCFLNFK